MKYSIVIPTYNHCDDLLKPCIESIIRNTDMDNIEIIVVANGCNDNTREYVEGLSGNVKLIWSDDALGYTKATNLGIKGATGEYVLLVNNDVQILDYWPKNRWLEVLTEPFLTDDKMAITGTVKYNEPSIDRDFLIFFCVLIKRVVFESIGLLDEIFSPGYGEDIDFCLRVENSGLKWKCVNNTTLQDDVHIGNFPVYHKGTATFSEVNNYQNNVIRNKDILKERYLNVKQQLFFLSEQDPALYREVITDNQYHLSKDMVKNRTVIDIGANIGAFSLYAAKLGAKRIVAIEPVSKTYNILLKNIYNLDLNNITTHKKIVTEISNLFLPISLNINSGENSIYNVDENSEIVETITFSDILKNIEDNNILLKMDCEGGEYDVIVNSTIDEMNKISEIVLEIHTDLHNKYKGKEILENKLIEFGFNMIDSKQIYYWDFDKSGNMINQRELPFVNQHWKRNDTTKK